MAQLELPPGLRPSLKDLLFDPESIGTKAQPGYTLEEILASVRNDLEDLLNTRHTCPNLDDEFSELSKSIVTYGMPDLSAVAGTQSSKQAEIASLIEKIIMLHEPRLRNVKATIIKT